MQGTDMAADNDVTGRISQPPLELAAEPGPRVEGVLTVLRGPYQGFVFTLDAQDTIIGRAGDSTIAMPDEGLSRHHAKIRRVDSRFLIEDLSSTNGTYVDGKRLRKEVRLSDGQRILLGAHTALRFTLHDRMELDAAKLTLELAVRDPLTRLYNRRHLNHGLQAEAAYSRRHRVPLSVLLIDIDNFKRINDELGHDTGDAVIRALSETLQVTVRSEDLVARYGGEEFAIVARGIDERGAITLGERIREAVQAMRLPAPMEARTVTVSVGIAHAPHGCSNAGHTMLHAADQVLYVAKRAGRNQVKFIHVGGGADE